MVHGRLKHFYYSSRLSPVSYYLWGFRMFVCFVECSRRDDLESLGLSLLSMLRHLPWDDPVEVNDMSTDEYEAHNIAMRASTSIQDLCKDTPGSQHDEYIHRTKHCEFQLLRTNLRLIQMSSLITSST